jgi:hypothetical protein
MDLSWLPGITGWPSAALSRAEQRLQGLGLFVTHIDGGEEITSRGVSALGEGAGSALAWTLLIRVSLGPPVGQGSPLGLTLAFPLSWRWSQDKELVFPVCLFLSCWQFWEAGLSSP